MKKMSAFLGTLVLCAGLSSAWTGPVTLTQVISAGTNLGEVCILNSSAGLMFFVVNDEGTKERCDLARTARANGDPVDILQNGTTVSFTWNGVGNVWTIPEVYAISY